MQKKINHIVLISSSYSSSGEGSAAAGSFVHDYAIELSKLAKVTILAPDTIQKSEQTNNINILRFKVPKLPLSILRVNKPIHWYYIFKTLYLGSIELKKLIEKEQIDHIFALWTLPCGLWAFRAHQNHRIPYSCWSLGSDIWSFKNNLIGRYFIKRILKQAQNIYADGYSLANDVSSISGKECTFLPSTRKLPKITFSEKKHNGTKLLYLGRWHPNKGIDLLIDSLNYLEDEDWNHIDELIIAGGGELEPVVNEKCLALRKENRPIRILGYQDIYEAANLIARTDYLIIPSRIESIPVIFSDALQFDTPIISTPVGDLPTLFEKYSIGFICKSTTPQAISLAIRNALKTSPLHFSEGIERARKLFNINTAVQKFFSDL